MAAPKSKSSRTKAEVTKDLEVLAADGIQENEKPKVEVLVKELENLGAVEEVVATSVEIDDAVAVKDIGRANILSDVLVGYEYRVSAAVANIMNEYNWQASESKVSGKDVDVIATVKYWIAQGHTNRSIVVV